MQGLKEKLEQLVIAAPKEGIGNAVGMMKYITDLMQQAYELGKTESAEKIEALTGNLESMQQTKDQMGKRLLAIQHTLEKVDSAFDKVNDIRNILRPTIESLYKAEDKWISVTQSDIDFIVDNALNGLWNLCEEKLKLKLGDIEEKNLIECRDRCKAIMKKLDPTLF